MKVLDFGLAKTMQKEAPVASSEDSPTFTISATRAGMVLGTAAYMSPEQARGKNVDKRADIWAFGVVLYELLTGERPFHGDDLTEVLASVVKESPDLGKVPVKVRRLLGSCLEKDPKKRLRDIGDAWRLLEEPAAGAAKKAVVWPWAATAVLAVVAAIVGWVRPAAKEVPSLLFDIVPPSGVALNNLGSNGAAPVISPDGSAVLYGASNRHYVRRLDSLESRLVPLSGITGNPAFWSPDSTTVVYPNNGARQWMKVRMPDGAPQGIALLEGPSRSGSWSESGTILFSQQVQTLLTAPATGGDLKPVVLPEQLSGGRITYPEFLPGRDDFLFFFGFSEEEEGAIYLATFREGKALNPTLLALNDTPGRYTQAGGGRLLFIRNDSLYSQPLNLSARKLDGEPELVVKGVASGQTSDFSVSRNGTIAWRPGTSAQSQVTEFDRQGNIVGTPGPMVPGGNLSSSPDGKQLLVHTRPNFLWTAGQTARIELPKGVQWAGWSAGGAKLIGVRGNALVETSATGSSEVRELRRLPGETMRNLQVSVDGMRAFARAGGRIVTFPLEGTTAEVQPKEVEGNVQTTFLSPDGHWLLYVVLSESVRTGGLYVQPFPGPGLRRQIAPRGNSPVWRGDGKEILYYDAGSLMSVSITGGASPTFGAPKKLFDGLRLPPTYVVRGAPLAVSPDGSRIYWLQGIEQPESNVVHVKIGAVR